MMEVVSINLTPVKPYMAQFVSLGVGQRVEVIVTANSSMGSYCLRAIPTSCASNRYDGLGTQNAIIRYAGAPAGPPNTTTTPPPNDCFDEPAKETIPFVAKFVNYTSFNAYRLPIGSSQQVTTNGDGRIFRWTLGKTTQNIDWQSPILQRFIEEKKIIW